jgi:hypothetical protein
VANLTINIRESVDLGNGRERTNITSVIPDINQVTRRVDTISNVSDDVDAIPIITFSADEESQTAGSFVRTDVKYIRITNLDPTNDVEIFIIPDIDNNIIYTVNPGRSLMLSSAEGRVDDFEDYVDNDYVESTFFINITELLAIKAKAKNAPAQIEYFVASS